MADLSGIIQSAPQLLRDVPFFINLAQLLFYIGLVFTFGGFVMKGYRGFLPWYFRLVGRLAFGSLALITGIGISWIIPPISNVSIYAAIQATFLNILIGGIIGTAVLYLALRLISHNIFNIPGIRKQIEKLQDLEQKAIRIEHEEAKTGKQGIKNPIRLAGVVALAVFLAIGLAGFRGFPSPLDEFGMSPEDLENMADQMEGINAQYGDRISEIIDEEKMDECLGAASALGNQAALDSMQPSTDSAVQAMIEDYSGESVVQMFSIQSEGNTYTMALTDTMVCMATENVVCLCEDKDQA